MPNQNPAEVYEPTKTNHPVIAVESVSPAAPIVNYFKAPAAALRYASNRPAGHGQVLTLMERTLTAELPVERALDVGCGTGHSTVALLPYARSVIGIDPSSPMLAQAQLHPRIEYRKAYAEALPFRQAEFDLVTVSSAYHWFDHERFLREAARVLRNGGYLVLYKAGSMGTIDDQPTFDCWRRDVLRARYPRVARNTEPLTTELAAQSGFIEVLCEKQIQRNRYSLTAYVENLMTHSSIIRVVDGGQESVTDARAWLNAELAPFFAAGETEFSHEARIHVLRREARA